MSIECRSLANYLSHNNIVVNGNNKGEYKLDFVYIMICDKSSYIGIFPEMPLAKGNRGYSRGLSLCI